MKHHPRVYWVRLAMASVVMYYVLELSKSGRTAIDFIVIGRVGAAILFNMIQLVRRSRRPAATE